MIIDKLCTYGFISAILAKFTAQPTWLDCHLTRQDIFASALPQEIFRLMYRRLRTGNNYFGLSCQAKIVWVTLLRPFVKVRALRGGVSHLPWVFAQESRSPYRNKRLGQRQAPKNFRHRNRRKQGAESFLPAYCVRKISNPSSEALLWRR